MNFPIDLSVTTTELVPTPVELPKSKLGLILGLTIGGLLLVGLGAFFFIRYQRRQKQSHLDY